MQITLNDWEKQHIAKQAKEWEVPAKLLENWYKDTMDSNFEQDIHDILSENYNDIRREAGGDEDDE